MNEPLYHLSEKSSNAKTGPMAVSTSSGSTCPDVCPLKERGCYAKSGPLALHWAKITKGLRGMPFGNFLTQVRKLRTGTMMRHNQAGDLPGTGDYVNVDELQQLTEATSHLRAFTYTHKPVLTGEHAEANRAAVKKANEAGFTINLSANSVKHADDLYDLGIAPVCTLLPADWDQRIPTLTTPKGRRIIVCPATYKDNVSCSTCQMCMDRDRAAVIGFPAHGTGAKIVERVFLDEVLLDPPAEA